jgi:carboxypeptidase Taq
MAIIAASPLEALKQRLFDLNALHAAAGMMDWDQQVNMPPGGAEARAEHVSRISRMYHEIFTDDETQKLIDAAHGEASGDDIDLLRVVQRSLDLRTKLPTELVARKSHLASLAHEKWLESRSKNDFQSFAPILEEMFEIARQEAENLGYSEHIYDALADQYEEGATAAEYTAMFETMKQPTVELVRKIKSKPAIDDSRLYGEWDIVKQKAFTEGLAKAIGFDFDRGRQDTAPHPFCTGWSVGDIRITTRFKPYIGSAIFGTLHETGHALYEQGSPKKWDRSFLAGGVSLGVHESQSRTWENIVGRSRAFWKKFLPELQSIFPALSGFNTDSFYRAINKVEPSLIRVEADEVTYNLHVMARYELECELLTGKLAVKDLPDAWNAKYEQYLGITPPTDAEGCLQDVHWSGGAIGYFPTYSKGNLLSYQIWKSLQIDLGDTDSLIESGNFSPILNWLTEKVYALGSSKTPKDVILNATGKPLAADDYLAGLNAKYSEIYDL